MSEKPKSIQMAYSEQLSIPEATPDTLHDVAINAWQENLDAIRDDELLYGKHPSLRLYPTDNPRDSILIFPMDGHKSMEEGAFRMLRRKGSKTTDLIDLTTAKDGRRIVSTLKPSDISPVVAELIKVEEVAIARMQRAIEEASVTRPMGKFAKAIGRIAVTRK